MKKLKDFNIDWASCVNELAEFKQFLSDHHELDERKQILPFFGARPNLSAAIGLLFPETFKVNKLAFEFDIFGDFKADLAIGDSATNHYCFIEFEDAKRNSIFQTGSTRYLADWSPRFEHGFSQISDWFWKLSDVQKTEGFEDRFGTRHINYYGILIIGRSHFIDNVAQKRLKWRQENILINSKHIYYYTFDKLYDSLYNKLQLFQSLLG